MAPASNKRKHLTKTPSSSEEDDFETSELRRGKLRKRSSANKTGPNAVRNSSDKNESSTATELTSPGSAGSRNQGPLSNNQEVKLSKVRKVKGKSAKVSAAGKNGTELKDASVNGTTAHGSPGASTSGMKRTERKVTAVVNSKQHGKKLALDLSDDDSDSDQDNPPCSQKKGFKKSLSASRCQKDSKTATAQRKAAEPTPSRSKGTPSSRHVKKPTSAKSCMKESLKVKVKKSSASQKSSSKESAKKSTSSTDKKLPTGSKKTAGKGKAEGQEKKVRKEADSYKGLKGQQYVNLEDRDLFDVTRRKSGNIVLSLNRTALGLNNNGKVNALPHESYLRTLRSLGLYRTASPFDCRVTALEWHPSHPTLVAAGSKGGDIILWNFEKVGADCFIQGGGPGCYVSSLKFWPWNDSQVYTTQLDGTVNLLDFSGRNNRKFLDTQSWSFWYCSVDVNVPHKMMAAGDNVGNVVMMNTEGDKLWQHRLHKSKVNHLEFNPGCDWLMVTASADKTVKLWDIRMVEGRGSALYTLEHDHIINSAYFSSNDHCKLLTTDQHHDIRVYSGPDWGQLDTVIYHPHRFFRYLSPFKASWHPLYDLAVVGRYPDNKSPHHQPGETNTIDILNINTGETVCQLWDRGAPGIKPLNRFSPGGDALVSGMGCHILIWQRKEVLQEKQEKLMEKMRGEVAAHLDTPGVARRPRPRRPPEKMAAKIKKKLQDL